MREESEVLFATKEEIARHIQTCRAAGQYSPRIDKLPYHAESVSAISA